MEIAPKASRCRVFASDFGPSLSALLHTRVGPAGGAPAPAPARRRPRHVQDGTHGIRQRPRARLCVCLSVGAPPAGGGRAVPNGAPQQRPAARAPPSGAQHAPRRRGPPAP
eukprot:362393-Chlamydomonas_euryale.AAC.7